MLCWIALHLGIECFPICWYLICSYLSLSLHSHSENPLDLSQSLVAGSSTRSPSSSPRPEVMTPPSEGRRSVSSDRSDQTEDLPAMELSSSHNLQLNHRINAASPTFSSLSPVARSPLGLTTLASPLGALRGLEATSPLPGMASLAPGSRTPLGSVKKPRERTLLPCEVCGKAFDRPSLLRRYVHFSSPIVIVTMRATLDNKYI